MVLKGGVVGFDAGDCRVPRSKARSYGAISTAIKVSIGLHRNSELFGGQIDEYAELVAPLNSARSRSSLTSKIEDASGRLRGQFLRAESSAVIVHSISIQTCEACRLCRCIL